MASLTTNEKKLDRIFSEFVRRSHADENGYVRCYTCEWIGHWKECDAGHYVSRTHKGTRWDERNVKPQCKKCNSTHEWGRKGNLDEYALHLIKDYGQEVLDELNRAKWIAFKIHDFQIVEMIKDYKEKLKEL